MNSGFIYSLLSMVLFSYDSQHRLINLGKVYRAFTSDSFFFSSKNNEKAEMQMCESASSPYIKINIPFFCCHLFFKDFSTPRINKMVNKHFLINILVFRFNLKDKSSHIPRNSLGFYLSSEYLLKFLSNL